MDRSGQRPGGRGQISDSLERLGNRYVVDMSMLFFFFLGFVLDNCEKPWGKGGKTIRIIIIIIIKI